MGKMTLSHNSNSAGRGSENKTSLIFALKLISKLIIELKERISESRKFVTQKHFPRKGMADFVGCVQGHFLL